MPTYLGRRTAVHQASLGCPFSCNFCGVVTVFGSREKMESPARTAAILQNLRETYRIDSIQFYDNNFFLKEDHAQELCQRIRPLHLKWWCEARIDIVLGYSDQTLQQIREAGCKMIFFGAESGSDWVLKEMKKQVRTEQTLLLAARIRRFGIVPEFSFVIGNPKDPERDTSECLQFIRKIKKLNPASEIILQHYTPVPQRDAMYGGIETEMQFPATVEEWANDRWLNFTLRKEPGVSWLPRRIKKKIDNFELVLNSSWPTVQDVRLPAWGRTMLKGLGRLRYTTKLYSYPIELEWAQQWIKLRKPKIESL
ncbi:MAG: radical SAM protein [Terriglobia bacterium]